MAYKIENTNRKFDYNKDKMMLTVSDTYLVDKDDIPMIIENINELNEKNSSERKKN